jgi:Tfp pilus assembly protein PilO
MKNLKPNIKFKINIEDYLLQVDNLFKDKSQKDIYVTYVMIFAVIFAFSYLLFWDTSLKEFESMNANIKSINSKIDKDKNYLRNNTEVKVARLNRDIENLGKELDLHKQNNAYIKTKIETIASLIYDERAWGEYLHSISIDAKKYHVKIIDFTNKYALHNESFGHILDVSLKTTGNYKNTLKFINSLEQSDLVVDIHDISLKAEDKLNSDLNISVWGITY